MEQKSTLEYEEIVPRKNRFSAVVMAILAALSVLLVLLSALFSVAAFNTGAENTSELFGYKIFYCENDIEGTDIKEGSLIIIKNTDDDEFYTPEFLSQNAALVIPKMGALIKQNGFFIVLSIMIPFILMFLIIFLSEFKKIYSRHEENKRLEIDFSDVPVEEFTYEE